MASAHVARAMSSALSSEGTALLVEDSNNVKDGETVNSGSASSAMDAPGGNTLLDPRKYVHVVTNIRTSGFIYVTIATGSPTASVTGKCIAPGVTRHYTMKAWGEKVAVVDVA